MNINNNLLDILSTQIPRNKKIINTDSFNFQNLNFDQIFNDYSVQENNTDLSISEIIFSKDMPLMKKIESCTNKIDKENIKQAIDEKESSEENTSMIIIGCLNERLIEITGFDFISVLSECSKEDIDYQLNNIISEKIDNMQDYLVDFNNNKQLDPINKAQEADNIESIIKDIVRYAFKESIFRLKSKSLDETFNTDEIFNEADTEKILELISHSIIKSENFDGLKEIFKDIDSQLKHNILKNGILKSDLNKYEISEESGPIKERVYDNATFAQISEKIIGKIKQLADSLKTMNAQLNSSDEINNRINSIGYLKTYDLRESEINPSSLNNAESIFDANINTRDFKNELLSLDENKIIDNKNPIIQVADKIYAHYIDSKKEIIVKLEPESLGLIKIKVSSGDKLEIEIQTQFEHTRQILNDSSKELKNSLELKGLNVDDFIFSTSSHDFKERKDKKSVFDSNKNIKIGYEDREFIETSLVKDVKNNYFYSHHNIDMLA